MEKKGTIGMEVKSNLESKSMNPEMNDLYRRGLLVSAMLVAERWLATDPADDWARLRQARGLEDIGRFRECMETLDSAYQNTRGDESRNKIVCYHLSDVFLDRSRYAKALEYFREAETDKWLRDFSFVRRRLDCELLLEMPDDCQATLRALAEAANTEDERRSVDYQRGLCHLQVLELAEAFEAFHRARPLGEGPSFREVDCRKAIDYLAANGLTLLRGGGGFENGQLTIFTDLLSSNDVVRPGRDEDFEDVKDFPMLNLVLAADRLRDAAADPVLWRMAGAALNGINKLKVSEQVLRHALSLRDDVSSHLELAITFRSMGRFEEALAQYDLALPDRSNGTFDDLNRLTHCLTELERIDECEPVLASMKSLANDDDQHCDVECVRACLLRYKRQFVEALKTRRNCRERWPELVDLDTEIEDLETAIDIQNYSSKQSEESNGT